MRGNSACKTGQQLALLESETQNHKIYPIGTSRLIAMVSADREPTSQTPQLQLMFGLVLSVQPRQSKSKHELPAARIHRQCNPRGVEVAFLTIPATRFFADKQLNILRNRYAEQGCQLELVDAQIIGNKNPLPNELFLILSLLTS